MGDRKNGGGCTPSIVSGSIATVYDGSDDHCSKEINKYDQEVCKNKDADLSAIVTKLKSCWTTNSIVSVDHMINYFCLPQVTSVKSDKKDTLVASLNACKA